MLFTTTTFVLVFLPLALLGFFQLGRRSSAAAAAWLTLASLCFYAWWVPVYTLLLLASIGVNFAIGLRLAADVVRSDRRARPQHWLVLGIVFNLGLLGYFKYANFFVDNLQAALGTQIAFLRVLLPIGISFYSFTQIAFLVDARRGKVREPNVVHYALFVTYFPHLIAGPVLHHAQMMPQFDDRAIYSPRAGHLTAGVLIFCLGLIKKVVLADGIAPYSDAVFRPADGGQLPTTEEAWLAAIAYTLQLYFDFSGYSDMAIGLSWLFNIRLPFNFNSPYRAGNISDFWRRWHISLSTFLRDYLYIPLGGNRRGLARRYANLAATMLLGGLWHGASWSFVVWGGLHGAYLAAHQAFVASIGSRRQAQSGRGPAWRLAAWALTMFAVVVAWVFFRAESLAGAGRMLRAMAGAGSPEALAPLMWNAGLHPSTGLGWCLALTAVATLGPNSNRAGEWLLAVCAGPGSRPSARRAAAASAGLFAVLFLVLVNASRSAASAFIYFNF